MAHSEKVRKYYDKNTNLFLRLGKDEKTRNIHAALWEEKTSSLHRAMHFANELIYQEILQMKTLPDHILDLGSGVGSSLFYLAEKLPSVQKFTGISISNKQVATANHYIPADMEDRIQFVEGDFLGVSDFVQQADVAFSIEAFAHSENALEFFKEVGKVLPSKGRLVIIDDVLTEYEPETLTADHSTLINTYKACWLLPSLHSLSELQQFSEKAGFALRNEKDLTALLKIRRPRDRFISFFLLFLSKLADYSYYWKSLKGGDAKQRCYQKGLTAYKCLVFEKE